jgi:hypothetical protein
MQRGMVVAVTAADAPAVRPFALFGSLTRLRPQGILIWALSMGRVTADPFPPFPHDRLPLRLSTFRVEHGWEGQPAPNVEQRMRAVSVAGWNLDVRVFFATQRPSKKLVARAQAELDRLLLPTR